MDIPSTISEHCAVGRKYRPTLTNRKLAIALSLLMAYHSSAFGCKDPDFNYWPNMKAKQLSQYGCVKDHIKLEIAHRQHNSGEVIKLAKKLGIKGLLDKPSLEREAEAFYRIGQFNKALNARIKSFTKPKKCEVFIDCRFDFTDAVLHYENSKFYRAAGYLYKSEEELKIGDYEFTKSCPLSGENTDYCTTTRNRLIEYVIPNPSD